MPSPPPAPPHPPPASPASSSEGCMLRLLLCWCCCNLVDVCATPIVVGPDVPPPPLVPTQTASSVAATPQRCSRRASDSQHGHRTALHGHRTHQTSDCHSQEGRWHCCGGLHLAGWRATCCYGNQGHHGRQNLWGWCGCTH